MINLLPIAEKEKLSLEKSKRMVIILWLLLLFFLTCLILILFSIRIYIQAQVRSEQYLLTEVKKEKNQSEIENLKEEINSINLSLTKLNSFYQNGIYLSDILERISKTLPNELYLINLSVIFSSVSLSGFAPTTEALFKFKENLEKEPGFKEISFPPGNWVDVTDIDFSITFIIDY